jgi:hypothetical protein
MIAWESHPLDGWKSNWDRLPVERRVPPMNDKYVTITADGIESMMGFWQGGRQPWQTPRAAVLSVCYLLLQRAELWVSEVRIVNE